MLQIDLHAAHAHPVETTALMAADDPVFGGLDLQLREPVAISGRLIGSGPGRYYWHGELGATVAATCRRCLAPVAVAVAHQVRVLFTEDETAEDASTYVIPRRATELDLGQVVREELILAVPEYVLCRDDCRGLCSQCGKDLNEGACSCGPEPDPRWAALEALKAQGSDDQR